MKKPLPIAIAERFDQLSIDHLPDGYPAIQQKQLNAAATLLRAQHGHIVVLSELLKKSRDIHKFWERVAPCQKHIDAIDVALKQTKGGSE